MDFTNRFTVNVPLERVWEYMIDAEKVTPCVPGAALTETIDQTHYKGTVKVKLGAVQMSYRGELEMEPDEAAHTIVLHAKGTEVRGSGGASGTVTTQLTATDDGGTTIEMASHVDVTGRVAQFGRGIMQDVANRLVKDFAGCLEAQLTSQQAESAPPAAASTGSQAAPSADTQSSAESSAASARPTRAPVSTAPVVYEPTPIRPLPLLADVARSRTAWVLRKIADRIEPR
jgi:carbon monoxide dehydrogenase subunit G